VPFCRPGRYNLRIDHPTGRRGRSMFDVDASEPVHVVEVVCQAPR
jgi:hypothetical protein